MKNIILNVNDVPSVKQLTHAINRLRKDYILYKKMQGNFDVEDPNSLRLVASFLEMFIKRNKKHLQKDINEINIPFDETVNSTCNWLLQMDDWELKRFIDETHLGDLVKRIDSLSQQTIKE